MISWITANIGTLVAAAFVTAVIIAACYVLIKDKKKGKSSCGSGCAHCPMAGRCHELKNTAPKTHEDISS